MPLSTLDDLHQELWKDRRYRFWHRVYGPRYWIERKRIQFRIWRRRKGDLEQ